MKEDILDFKSARSSNPERIIEILVLLLGQINGEKQDLSQVDFNSLASMGFTDAEISTACSWLIDRMSSSPHDREIDKLSKNVVAEESSKMSFRVYHEAERKALTPEAQGYLMQMRELKLITEHEMETLLDRISQLGFLRIDVKDLKELVSGVLFEFDDSYSRGSRLMLNLNDTIH